MSKRASKPVAVVRSSDRRAVLKSIYLRGSVFGRTITPADVRSGLLPRRTA